VPQPDALAGKEGDGLDELIQRRQKRRPLAPMHPRQAPRPGESTSSPSEATAQPETPAPAVASPTPVIRPARQIPPPKAKEPARPQSAPEADEALRLAQFYVNRTHDQYLRQVRAAALTRGVDVTASAVARYALSRMMDELSVEQMVDLLGEPKERKGRGRPRH
jgi:hypothetical protein